jgi:hypothetical protein
LPRIWLAIHSSTWVSMLTACTGAQLSIGVSGDSATVRGGTGRPDSTPHDGRPPWPGDHRRKSVVVALGGVADFKQRLDLGGYGLMLDCADGQEARAPGGVIRIGAREMDTPRQVVGLAGDHAVTHDGAMRRGLAAEVRVGGSGYFNGLSSHVDIALLILFIEAFPCWA